MSSFGFSGIARASIPDIVSPSGSNQASAQPSFASVLSNAVNTVDKLHDSAAEQVSNLLQGRGADLNQVMIAVEKADVSFQLMMQVRNKIVSAYQDIEKMQF